MPERVKGIDVSHHQADAGAVDFAKAYAAGVRFCYVKLTEGESYRDPAAAALWQGARASGMLVGGYHFARFGKDPEKQAAHFAGFLAELGGGELPPALDAEPSAADWKAGPPSVAQVRDVCRRFLIELKTLTPAMPVVYTAPAFADEHTLGSFLGSYPLWVAHYGVKAPRLPRGWGRWAIWQELGDKGRCPGFPGPVDINQFNGGEKDLANWARDQRRA